MHPTNVLQILTSLTYKLLSMHFPIYLYRGGCFDTDLWYGSQVPERLLLLYLLGGANQSARHSSIFLLITVISTFTHNIA